MASRQAWIKNLKIICTLGAMIALSHCGGGGGGGSGGVNIDKGVFGPNVSGTPDTFRGAGIVNDSKFLFTGPVNRGREGDILMQNDQIRVIIQKPSRSAGVGLFGGDIIDADRFRPSSEPGQDEFKVLFPLINLSWTANYQRLEIINADFANGPIVVRATGVLDVYDYIQTNIIVPFAKIFVGADLTFSDQFDDALNPFKNMPDLRGLNPIIVTDYTLKQDSSYVILETKFENDSDKDIKMPVGDWVNGQADNELFVPGHGFVRTPQVDNSTALIYQAMGDDVGVSYGYFYNPIQFIKDDGSLPAAASLSVSGVTPMVLGESSLLNIIPIGGGDPTINFKVEHGIRTITRYFVIGTGDVASVMDEGLKAIGVSKIRLSGTVTDANGQPAVRARVVVIDKGNPVTVAFSDKDGNFAADVSSGTDAKDQIFGSGTYTVEVYKEGYVLGSGPHAGLCTGGHVDTGAKTVTGVACKLGNTASITVTAKDGGQSVPARVTIVGFDPSPIHDYGNPPKFGKYADVNLQERPYGVVDSLYLDPTGQVFPVGNPRVMGTNQIRLEPGEYEIYVMRGPEYSIYKKRITLAPGGTASIDATLTKLLDTSGYVSGDFHVHGINSPDSVWKMETRIRMGMGEGLDILCSNDHEYLTEYQPLLDQLGYGDWLRSFTGDEITPLAYGHMITWPLQADDSKPDHGAYDYSHVETDDVLNPDHDYVQSLSQIIQGVDQANPGTQVFSIAHITDKALGNFSISKLVTTEAFEGIPPLSTYSDPIQFRLPANTNAAGNYQAPFPLGTSEMITTDFTSMGLTIGTFSDIFDHLMQTSLPTYFNVLNLGKIVGFTGDSDTHSLVREPVGIPRNYILSSKDPRDGIGSFHDIDQEEIAVNLNGMRAQMTNGIFIRPKLSSTSNPGGVSLGGTITGGDVTLDLDISSIDYFDWDRVEVYANTEPTPAKDDLSGLTDLGAEEFHSASSSHIAKYLMAPAWQWARGGSGDAVLNQTVSGGIRKATLSHHFNFSEDTWIVIVAYGSKGVRSTFPFVPKQANTKITPATFLDTLDSNPVQIGGIQAWSLTNPMFVDVDGNGFEAIHIKDGTSPLVKK